MGPEQSITTSVRLIPLTVLVVLESLLHVSFAGKFLGVNCGVGVVEFLGYIETIIITGGRGPPCCMWNPPGANITDVLPLVRFISNPLHPSGIVTVTPNAEFVYVPFTGTRVPWNCLLPD